MSCNATSSARLAPGLEDVEDLIRLSVQRGYCLVRLPDGSVMAKRLGVSLAIAHMLAELRDIHGVLPPAARQAGVVDIRTGRSIA